MSAIDEVRALEDAITKVVQASKSFHLKEVMRHALEGGAKRSRPRILLLAGNAFGAGTEECLNAAVAVEIMHTASLLHDDILDKGTLRRGKTSSYEQFGSEYSMLCGDYMICKSLELLAGYPNDVLVLFASAGQKMADGEALELTDAIDEKLYYEEVEKKTASIFAAAAGMGAAIGGASRSAQKALMRYGTNVGVAYQITDDLLEYMGLWGDKKAKNSSTYKEDVRWGTNNGDFRLN